MDDFHIIEKMVQDLPPKAFDSLPRETRKIVIERLEIEYEKQQNNSDTSIH